MRTIRRSPLHWSLILLGVLFLPTVPLSQELEPEFSITEAFMKELADQNSLMFKLEVSMDARTSKVHRLSEDCEIHIAGLPAGDSSLSIADPPFVVVEPPNLCKIHPPGVPEGSETKLRDKVWPNFLDEHVMLRTCEVRGYPRIYPEHLTSSSSGANPPHFIEVHPALGFTCDGFDLDLTSFMTVFPGMRSITKSSFGQCMEKSQLFVRKAGSNYEFSRTFRGSSCGNFIELTVTIFNPEWIRKINGGHSAISVVSEDGLSSTSLKIYTYEGTPEDDLLAGLKDDPSGERQHHLHGMLTFDYFSIMKTVRNRDRNWLPMKSWSSGRKSGSRLRWWFSDVMRSELGTVREAFKTCGGSHKESYDEKRHSV